MRPDAASPDISPAYQKTHTFWQHGAAWNGGVAYSQLARAAARWGRPTCTAGVADASSVSLAALAARSDPATDALPVQN